MKRSASSLTGFFTIVVAGLFLAGFFLTVVLGAQAYREIVTNQTENNRVRALLSYLTTCARENDAAGAVDIIRENGGPVLVITDDGTGYCLRIYQHDGCLMEDFGGAGTDLDPSEARIIGETEIFRVEEVREGTYAVITDAGRVLFHTRCDVAAKSTEAVADEK